MTAREKVRYVADRWRPYRAYVLLLAALTLVSSAVAVAYPLALLRVVDDLEAAVRRGGAAPAAGGVRLGNAMLVLGLVILGRIVAGFYPAFRSLMNNRIEADIRAEVFARILEKDHRFARAFRTGDVVTRLTDDLSEFMRVAWFCCSGIFRAVESASKLLFCAGAMLLLEPRLAVLSVAPIPVMLCVFYVVQRRLRAAVEAQQEAISRTNDVLESAFSGIKILKAFRAEEPQARALEAVLRKRAPIQLAVMKLFSLFSSAQAFAATAGQVVALAVGGLLVARGELDAGTVYAFFMYLSLLVQPLQDLPMLLVSGRTAFVSVERVEELARFEARLLPPDPQEPVLDGLASFEVRDLSFTFEDAKLPALDGVSFGLARGERLAVVGEIGGGKSTLLRSILGLLPADGRILAGGRDLAEVGWRRFRGRVGYVPQEPHLFSESIRENVSLGRASPEATERALEVAQLGPDLARLEGGAGAILGAKGSLISGGQRQRVAIARAIARRPDLLLLDDATASLDAGSEDRFWAALDASFPDIMTIVTTHRVATVRRASRVLLLERGRVAASGTHEELLERCKSYRELLAAG